MSTDYHVEDHSVLVPYFKRLIWSPIVPHIPAAIAANTLTLTGTALSALAFAITALVPATRLSCAVVALLVFAYLTLDNVNGAHARRTGQSSPLGEFLDHWLDALNLSFLSMGAIHTWKMPPDVAVLVMGTAVLGYTMTFWEQRVTGRMHMGRLGNVEGITIVGLFYVAGAIFSPDALIHTPLLFGRTIIDVLWAAGILATSFTALTAIARVHRNWLEVLELLLPVVAVCTWYALGRIEALHACALLMMFTPALAGRMLIARVTERPSLGPDRLLTAFTLAGGIASVAGGLTAELQARLLSLIVAYAIAGVVMDFVLTVRRLGHHLRPGELLSFAVLWPRS